MRRHFAFALSAAYLHLALAAQSAGAEEGPKMEKLQTITLGAGCFWCIEAVLDRFEGVESVVSGYMGGIVKNPTYQQVCTGTTGHAEVVQVQFDPQKLPLEKLLDIFWLVHDPTTLNRQGPDIGTQYRSAIFYHNDTQRRVAEKSKKKWNESRKFRGRIVTEITEASEFYEAEDYHQEYFSKNPRNPYCRANILPKFKKLGLLKSNDLIP
jgi:peptide-methionine (S)-S-oxide reductase